ncbi:MAG: DUF2865 domain-containing protein [Bauldia sp.]|nr:DUF2865 domain-containing protein [Bauldia sp.]
MRLGIRFKPLAIAVFLLAATPAVAQQACLQLESQLAAIDRGGAQQQYNQLNAQYQQQRAAYDTAYRQAEQAGCIVLFRRFAPPQCTAILANLDQRQAGVRQLEQALAAANPGQVNAQRENILRALAANNCGPQYAAYGGPQQGGGLLDRLFGTPTTTIPYPGAVVPNVETFRTVCVRSCDGGFFPISFATTQAQFPADEATCRQQCPGAQLYVYRNPGGDMSTATNLAGERYTASPNAFLYQTAFNPTCGCHPGNGTTPVVVAQYVPTAQEQLAALRSVVPVPLRRPEPSEDPETVANRAGGLTPGIGATPAEATVAGVTEGGIRLIGPAYYYAQ